MKYFIIDTFTENNFKGNPAGVCILENELQAEILQSIAFENNLAETAFLIRKGDKYHLRWFTPETEVDLCGHATLAAAFVLMNFIDQTVNIVSFETLSGTLFVEKLENIYKMNFPSRKPKPILIPHNLENALGCRVLETQLSRDLLVLVENELIVKGLVPNFSLIKELCSGLGLLGIIVTASGSDCDFVSRFFAPSVGVNEDPVTGSSHSTLIPYWSNRLDKKSLVAKQLSQRGGTIFCEHIGERVAIGGTAVCYLKGEITV